MLTIWAKTGYVEMEPRWANQGYVHFKTYHADGLLFFAVKDSLKATVYMYLGNGIVYSYEDTTTAGNSDACGIMNTTKTNLTNDVWDNFPLAITNNGDNWFQGEYIAHANNVGCLFRYRTSGSSTYWWSGVWGSNTNGFNTRFNHQGLSLKSNGSAVLSGSLTQNSDASLKGNVEDVGLTDCMNMLENMLKHTPGTIWKKEIKGQSL